VLTSQGDTCLPTEGHITDSSPGQRTIAQRRRRKGRIGHNPSDRRLTQGEDGRLSEVGYRLHWARTHLKGIGALENSARGVWAVTDRGRSMCEPEMRAATKAWRDSFRERRLARRASQAAVANGGDEAEAEGDWKDQIIARLLQLPRSCSPNRLSSRAN
jgi:restriction system protein